MKDGSREGKMTSELKARDETRSRDGRLTEE